MTEYTPTVLSLAPALVAIVLAWATRHVIPSLFLGILTGSLVLWLHTGDLSSLDFISRFFLPAIGSEGYAKILLVYLWCLGGLVGMWEKTGGALHFAHVVGGRIARGPRSSLFFAWLLGVVFHQGGTVSTVLAGTTVKPVTDKHRVAHEEVAYVVDSTASPVATILPFNAWPGYVAALVVGTIPLLPDTTTAIDFFFKSLRFNFYAIFAVFSTLLFTQGWLPWVGKRMKAAKERARLTGRLDAEGARPLLNLGTEDRTAPGYTPSLWDFGVPLGVLIGLAVVPYVLFRVDFINQAFLACVLSAMGVALFRGMSLDDVIDGFVEGCRSMTIGAIVLGLAVTLAQVTDVLQTAEWVVGAAGQGIPMVALPAGLMVLCMGIAFATGTSFGTFAVVFPLAMPLAWALNTDPVYIQICFGAVLGGSVFGDQCSPISDTTILSSMFTGCDLMDHVLTQLPLAMAAALLGAIFSTLSVILLV